MTTETPAEPSIFVRRESEARSYCRAFDTVFDSASNAILRDRGGKEYIDFLAGCSSLNYGHNDPDMKQALLDYITRDGVAHGLDMHTSAKEAFLNAFDRHILQPRAMDHQVMFTGPTGANAVEAAMKIARKATGRTNIIAFTNGFHGVTSGALAATGNSYHRGGNAAPLGNVTRMPFDGYFGEDTDTAAQLEAMLDDPSGGIDAPAAVMLELVQGEGGLNTASPAWVKRIAAIAKRHGALLIVDDIQAGCGRTGSFFSFDDFGIQPDIICLAKSLSGFGLPMAALLVKPRHDIFRPAEHNGTFRGNNHAFVTAKVALEKFWADGSFEKEITDKSDLLRKALEEMTALVPNSRIKGRGFMLGIDVGSGDIAADICKRCFCDGLIIETSGAHDEVVKVLAPLTIEPGRLTTGLAILADAIDASQASFKIAAE